MNLSNLLILLFVIPLINCCSRIPEDKVADKSPSDGRYRISMYGNPQFYQPGQKYNVTLMGAQAIPPQTFIGFMLAVELDNHDFTDPTDIRSSGTFDLGDNNHEIKFSEKCKNLITHTNTLAKSRIQIIWTAPPPGSGCLNFRATVIQHRDVWFMDDGFLTKKLCEEQQDDIDHQPVMLDNCCACDEAKYQLTFESKWSRHTHPKEFPVDNWNTKFSDIIGASHNANYTFWKYGDVASAGVKQIAEHGVTETLENELLDELDSIRTIIKAKGITYPNLNGETNAVFRVDAINHVISIISMIQPSPDWIVGVSGLELCLPNCTWVEEKIQNLYPWDVGTDKGPSYDSPDQPQIPPDVIRRINPNDPRSPFYDPKDVPMKPIARLYVSRVRLYEKPCDKSDDRGFDECATHPWSRWSECDSRCGRGKMTRITKYKNEEIANRFGCDKDLNEEQTCFGNNCGQLEHRLNSNLPNYGGKNRKVFDVDDDAPDCALSDWSNLSQCSAKCGKGIQTQTRRYLNPNARRKCEKIRKEELEKTQQCAGSECGGNLEDDNDLNTYKSNEDNFRVSPDYNNRNFETERSKYDKSNFNERPKYDTTNFNERPKYDTTNFNERPKYDTTNFNERSKYDGKNFNRETYQPGQTNQDYGETYDNKNFYDGNRNFNFRCDFVWSNWSPCSESCGKGIKYAYRTPVDINYCQGNEAQELEIRETCFGNNCNDDDSKNNDRAIRLPRHCKYSNWSEWSACNATCDVGIKTRERTVWNPSQSYPTDSCGNETQYQYAECSVDDCEIENKFCYEQPLNVWCDNIVNYWYYDSDKQQCGLFFTGNCMNENFLNKFVSRTECQETCKKVPIIPNSQPISSEDLRLEKVDCKVSWTHSECLAPCGKQGFRKSEMNIIQYPRYGGKLCPKDNTRFEKCYNKCTSSSNRYNQRYSGIIGRE